MPHPIYGKRLSFKEAKAYLEIPESRLRRLVYEGRIAFIRTDGRTCFRTRHGKREAYIKSGRLEFYRADLDAYLHAQRIAAHVPLAPPRDPTRQPVDAEMEALIARTGAERCH